MADFRQYIREHHDAVTAALAEAHGNALRFPAWGQEVFLRREPGSGEIRLVTRDCLAGESLYETQADPETTLPLHAFFSPYSEILWDCWFDNPRFAIAEAEERFGVTFPRDAEGDLLDEDGEWFEADLRETLYICCRAAGVPETALEDWLAEQEEEAIEYEVSEAAQNGEYEEILEQAIERLGEA